MPAKTKNKKNKVNMGRLGSLDYPVDGEMEEDISNMHELHEDIITELATLADDCSGSLLFEFLADRLDAIRDSLEELGERMRAVVEGEEYDDF